MHDGIGPRGLERLLHTGRTRPYRHARTSKVSARRTVKSVQLACLPSATVALFCHPISSLLGGRAITRAIRDGCAKIAQFLYSLARAERADPFPTPIYRVKSRLLTCRYLSLALCRAQIILEHFWRPRQAHAAQEEWAKRDTQLVSAPCLERDERPPRALQQPPASGLLTSFSSVCLPISLFTGTGHSPVLLQICTEPASSQQSARCWAIQCSGNRRRQRSG